MSERIRRDAAAFRSTKAHALSIIDYHIMNHKAIYVSFEKNCVYDFTLKKARDTIARAYGRTAASPIEILEQLLVKYDNWAHTDAQSSEQFKVSVAAIEDLIDLLLTS